MDQEFIEQAAKIYVERMRQAEHKILANLLINVVPRLLKKYGKTSISPYILADIVRERASGMTHTEAVRLLEDALSTE